MTLVISTSEVTINNISVKFEPSFFKNQLSLVEIMTEMINKLKKSRATIKRQLTQFENVLNSVKKDTDLELLYLEARLEKHASFWDGFDQIQTKIDDLATTSEEEVDNELERSQFEQRFYAISGLAKKLLKNNSNNSIWSWVNCRDSAKFPGHGW